MRERRACHAGRLRVDVVRWIHLRPGVPAVAATAAVAPAGAIATPPTVTTATSLTPALAATAAVSTKPSPSRTTLLPLER